MKQDLDPGKYKFPYHRARPVFAVSEAVPALRGLVRRLATIDPDQQGRGLPDIDVGRLPLRARARRFSRNAGIRDKIPVVIHE